MNTALKAINLTLGFFILLVLGHAGARLFERALAALLALF